MSLPPFEHIRPLAGGGTSATVDLVRVDGREWVLKRHRPDALDMEWHFQKRLEKSRLPSLKLARIPEFEPAHLLIEYIPNSPTIGGNPSFEMCERWGAAIRAIHDISYPAFMEAADEMKWPLRSWSDFASEWAGKVVERQRDADLPRDLVGRAAELLRPLAAYRPANFVLTHGDLHLNNALIRNEQIILFDKGTRIWSGPAAFDLSLIFSEAFPGASFVSDRPGDAERLRAFLRGYGDLSAEISDALDRFILLRALERYPSPFVPALRDVILTMIERLEP